MSRFLNLFILLPLAIVLLALAVANRAAVPFTIDPFNPGSAGLTVEWPLFVYLFLCLAIGMVIGSLVTWTRQAHYRKVAREKSREARELRERAPHPDQRQIAPPPEA